MQLNKYIISTLLGFTLLTSLSAQSSVDIATPKSASRVHESYQLIYSGPILKKDSHYQDKSNLRKKITSGAPLGAKGTSNATASANVNRLNKLDWSKQSARTGADAAHHVEHNHGTIKLNKPNRVERAIAQPVRREFQIKQQLASPKLSFLGLNLNLNLNLHGAHCQVVVVPPRLCK